MATQTTLVIHKPKITKNEHNLYIKQKYKAKFDTAEEAVAYTHTVDSEVMISWYLEEN